VARLVSLHDAGSGVLRSSGGDASTGPRAGKKSGGASEWVELSVPEVRRLLHALGESEEQQAHRLRWSRGSRADIRGEHSASIGCAALARHPRCRQTHWLPCACWESLRPTSEHWEQVRPLLPPQQPQTGRPAIDYRLVVEGMLWVVRTGSSWRELPERFGPWSTVSSRYQRWCKEGLWARILQVLLPSEASFLSSA
jgi:putative transposase of IS4/5 family DUF4096